LLLKIFAGVLALSLVMIGGSLLFERLGYLEGKIREYRSLIEKLEGRFPDKGVLEKENARLEQEAEELKARFYRQGETDPYRLGMVLQKRIESHGLTVKRFQTVEVESRIFLDFSLQGDGVGLFRFLRWISEGEKILSLPSLTVRAGEGGKVEAELRIGYEIFDPDHL
jgi:hypothetical protein